MSPAEGPAQNIIFPQYNPGREGIGGMNNVSHPHVVFDIISGVLPVTATRGQQSTD